MEKIKLPNVTLTAVTSINISKTVKALQYSMRSIEFGQVVLISHKKPLFLPKGISFKYVEKIDNIDKFNYLMVYDIHKYIDTEYMMLIHYDGFVVNPQNWNDEFLKYDYIGAPWQDPGPNKPGVLCDADGTVYRVGNSVSLRSKRFMKLPSEIGLEWKAYGGWYNEDGFLCIHSRKTLERYGCKYAPVELAAQYSRELPVPEGDGIEPFCFHKRIGENVKYPRFTPIPWIRW